MQKRNGASAAVIGVALACVAACGNTVESGVADELGIDVDATDLAAPLLSGIGARSITASGATISWSTDKLATSHVEYGTSTTYGQSTPLYGLALKHSVAIVGLEAGALYHYRVKSLDRAGNLATSADFTFTTTSGTPPPSGGGGTGPGDHRFPYSFNDQQFFANAIAANPTNLSCGTAFADRTITSGNSNGDPVITNNCSNGTTTVSRVRLGGDGVDGTVREGYRCGGDNATMNIVDSWLEAKGIGDDHADVIQCYDPNNSLSVMNVSNTTIRHQGGPAAAGLFVADAYALELHVTDVLFWGGPYGLRFHTDGRPGSVYLNDVCFYGNGPDDHSFTYYPFLFNPYPPTIVQWNNVNWCTIENGQLMVHGAIPRP